MDAILKYPGSKWSYAEWINSYFPEHTFYLEPYFGSGAVFFRKNQSKYETINDIDGMVVNFFKACREYPAQLAEAIEYTPFSREEYMNILEEHSGEEIHITGDCVEDARRFAVRCFQGFGSKLSDRAGWKNTKTANGPINPVIWSRVPETIYAVAKRLKNAQIENTNAINLIRECDKDCLIYADPPYLGSTRKNRRIYRKEMMTEKEHIELLEALMEHDGPVILSGYENDMYNDMLNGWAKAHKPGISNSGAARIETIWMNFSSQIRFV